MDLNSSLPAAAGGDADAVASLLKRGLKVDQPGRVAIGESTVMTALQAAADAGHVEVVSVLIKHDAQLNLADAQGRTALYLAVASGHAEAAIELLAAGADPNVGPPGSTPLTSAT